MVSEFMLQQTTVTAVVPYFERWMKRFPTVKDLAKAGEQDVLSLWQGLGYYSRARNLHRAAETMRENHGGKVPGTAAELRALPGVGDYTAAAVAAFAFDHPEPVIDANIARVLARLFDWQNPIDDTAGKNFLRDAATHLLPKTGGRLHNSALMELGALVCVSRAPRCGECPVRENCLAKSPASLPVKRPRKTMEKVSDARAFVFREGKVWLEPSAGPRWRGMWLLPVTHPQAGLADHVEVFPITHFKVTMSLFAEPDRRENLTGFPPDRLPPMPSPHRRAVAALLGKRHSV